MWLLTGTNQVEFDISFFFFLVLLALSCFMDEIAAVTVLAAPFFTEVLALLRLVLHVCLVILE